MFVAARQCRRNSYAGRDLQQLWLADRHIDRAEQIIADQQLELHRLRLKGYETALAERTLKAFEDSLLTMWEHRRIIRLVIDQIDRGLV